MSLVGTVIGCGGGTLSEEEAKAWEEERKPQPIPGFGRSCADGENCEEWVSDSGVTNLGWYNFNFCNDCFVRLKWSSRPNCSDDEGCEIFIDHITFWGNCNNCTVGEIIRISIIQAMIYAGSGCQPDPQTCVENVRVWMPDCFFMEYDPVENRWNATASCASESCCFAVYRMCRGSGNYSLRLQRQSTETASCDGEYPFNIYPPDVISNSRCVMTCSTFPEGEIEVDAQ